MHSEFHDLAFLFTFPSLNIDAVRNGFFQQDIYVTYPPPVTGGWGPTAH